jgi:hypothetical protein
MKEDEVTEKKENGPPGVILRLLAPSGALPSVAEGSS